MTETITAQPSPRATARQPSWRSIMSYVDQLRRDNAHVVMGVGEDVLALVLSDMGACAAVGQGKSCDHLVAAYQQYLDACFYLMMELDEHGVGLATHLTEDLFPDQATRWHLHDVQQLCVSQIRSSIHLRAIIEERRQAFAGKERAS